MPNDGYRDMLYTSQFGNSPVDVALPPVLNVDDDNNEPIKYEGLIL